MSEAAWDESNVMLSNGQEMSAPGMAGVRQHSSGIRSQDDAMVGYFFQRPQNDVSQQYNSKRWAVGDDSVIEHVSPNCHLAWVVFLVFCFSLCAASHPFQTSLEPPRNYCVIIFLGAEFGILKWDFHVLFPLFIFQCKLLEYSGNFM